MTGLDPAIHVLLGTRSTKKDMDGRDKRGHDGAAVFKATPRHRLSCKRHRPVSASPSGRGRRAKRVG